jgi:hypothetical protein
VLRMFLINNRMPEKRIEVEVYCDGIWFLVERVL